MAPARSKLRARVANASKKDSQKDAQAGESAADRSPTSKRDKRRIKHSVLVSKAQASARVTKPTKKRRPSKKLKSAQNLEELVASLPEVQQEPTSATKAPSSIKSKPGVQKRRDAIAKQEQTRFSKNIAMINGQAGAASQSTAGANTSHWGALREHIASTMKK